MVIQASGTPPFEYCYSTTVPPRETLRYSRSWCACRYLSNRQESTKADFHCLCFIPVLMWMWSLKGAIYKNFSWKIFKMSSDCKETTALMLWQKCIVSERSRLTLACSPASLGASCSKRSKAAASTVNNHTLVICCPYLLGDPVQKVANSYILHIYPFIQICWWVSGYILFRHLLFIYWAARWFEQQCRCGVNER